MKLAVLVDTFPRWSERFIARECRELLRRGVELSIFCLKAGEDPPPDEREWDGLIERRIVLPRCLVPSLRGEKHLPAAVRVRREKVRAALGATAYAKVRCAESFTDLLRADGYKHVHAHFASLPSTIGWLAAMECGLPLTLSVHARDLFVDAQLLAEKAQDARAIFCCHSKAFDYLCHAHPHARAVLMPHGLPLDLFPIIPRANSSPAHWLAAGRFVEKKGFLELVEALSAPALREKEWKATLLGDGPLKKKIAARIQKFRLSQRVVLADAASGVALREHFARATLFIAPYKETAEGDVDGIANVLLETLALGIPLAASEAGSARAVVNAQTATVIAACEPPAIAHALLKAVLQDSGSHRTAGRTLIEQRFDIRRNITPLLEALQPR